MPLWSEIVKKGKREAATRYPPLPAKLRQKLIEIEPSQGIYFPCLVTLRTGERRDCVYLAPASPWFEQWGVWPEKDEGKPTVSLLDVMDIEESPSRLPKHFAEQVYEAGESGMGYQLFVLGFRDGTIASFLTGNMVDFPDLPDGKSPSEIVSVTPHAGRNDSHRRELNFSWCLFSGDQVRR